MPNKTIPIYYISQTGTCHYYAKLLHLYLKSQKINTIIKKPSLEILNLPLMIILISTVSDGQLPFKFQPLWNFLINKSLPENLISSKIYIFGLGDSSYEKYNFAAIKLKKRLEMIGGNVKMVLGDYQHKNGYLDGFKRLLEVMDVDVNFDNWFEFFDKNEIICNSGFEFEDFKEKMKEDNKSLIDNNKEDNKLIMNNKSLIDNNKEDNKLIMDNKSLIDNNKEDNKLIMDNKSLINDNKEDNKLIMDNKSLIDNNKEDNKLIMDNKYKRLNEYLYSEKKYKVKIIENKLLLKGEYDILELKLQINYSEFKPGDVILIKPKNYNINEFIEYNNINNNDNNLYEYLNSVIDFNCVPQQPVFYLFYKIYLETYFNSALNDNSLIDNRLIMDNRMNNNNNSLMDNRMNSNNALNDNTLMDNRLIMDNQFNNNSLMDNRMIMDNQFNNNSLIDNRMNIYLQKLKQLCIDYDEYYFYVIKPKRTIFEILKDFEIKYPLKYLNLLPEIFERFYTLTKINNHFEITISLVKYNTTLKNRKGLASEYLRNLNLNNTFYVEIIRNNLKITKNTIFISTGCGITVPRSFNYIFKDIIVFYGHRNKMDRLYVNEFKNIFDCMSREGNKIYVQKLFKNIFKENIFNYNVIVTGNYRMNREIRKLFMEMYGRDIKFQSETW